MIWKQTKLPVQIHNNNKKSFFLDQDLFMDLCNRRILDTQDPITGERKAGERQKRPGNLRQGGRETEAVKM